MKALGQFEVWFAAGSHDLYGDATLSRVDEQSREVAERLEAAEAVSVRIVHKPVLTNPESIRRLCLDANAADDCVGLIAWMHTFSPARMSRSSISGESEAGPMVATIFVLCFESPMI